MEDAELRRSGISVCFSFPTRYLCKTSLRQLVGFHKAGKKEKMKKDQIVNRAGENYHHTCLICGSEVLADMPRFNPHHLCRCKNCGLVFCRPIPNESELIAHYKSYGRNDYLSPVTVKRYHELLDTFEPLIRGKVVPNSSGAAGNKVGGTSAGAPLRVLDWGAGIGYFLDTARERGWETFGTEYTDRAVEICREKGITMFQGPLAAVDMPAASFDLISSFEVIEHINNPLEEIARIMYLLKPGGLFYCTTPNFNSLLRYYLKDAYNVITYPEHLSYYTPRTLHRLLSNAGLKRIYLKSTGISLTRFRKSRKRSDEKLISPESTDEKIRVSAERKWYMKGIKNIVNGILTGTGKGDTLKALYRNPGKS